MKKFILILTIAFAFLWQGAGSQNLIAVQNGGTPTFYTVLDSAIVAAQNGDTVYLPGGTFTCGTLNIDKRLHIIGAGINPDSSSITKVTQINGNFNLGLYAEGSTFTGFGFGGLTFFNAVSNIQVSRCNIEGIALGESYNSSSTNNVFYQNTIGTIDGHYAQGNTFFNNIISYAISNLGHFNLFKNNVFTLGGHAWCSGSSPITYAYLARISYSFFENNIFLTGYYSPPSHTFMCLDNCNFRNNIFMDNLDINNMCPDCGSFDNFINQPQSTVFIEGTYQLQPTCPGKNAGTDGTDIGIYGGLHPWKDGSLPVNPHVQFKNIYNSTDSTGVLKVNVKVSAQER